MWFWFCVGGLFNATVHTSQNVKWKHGSLYSRQSNWHTHQIQIPGQCTFENAFPGIDMNHISGLSYFELDLEEQQQKETDDVKFHMWWWSSSGDCCAV